MELTKTICPVCTLYLREGISLQTHLDTHPKEQVIEALLKVSYGGTSEHEVQETPTATFMPVQTFTNPTVSFLPQGSPYVNPQAQMTTAVTYQHFMTSNGNTVMPQYIQVPAIVNTNNAMPLTSNQPANIIPNQSINYPQTVYNPMFNPYIPQPYPFTQPVFTSIPVASLPPMEIAQAYNEESFLVSNPQINNDIENNDSSIINDNSCNQVESLIQSSVLVGRCNVSTNTEPEKRPRKVSVTKKLSVKNGTKNSTTNRLEESNPGNPNEIKTAAETTKVSVTRALQPKITSVTSLAITNSQIISAPAVSFQADTTRTITPPSPPLSKVSNYSSPVLNFIKSEDVTDCARPQVSNLSNENFLNNLTSNSVEYLGEKKNPVDNKSFNKTQKFKNNSKDCNKNKRNDESGSFTQTFRKVKSDKENLNSCLNENSNTLVNTKHEDSFNVELEIMSNEESSLGEEDLGQQQETFQMDIEENKIDIFNTSINEDFPKECYIQNIEKHFTDSDIDREKCINKQSEMEKIKKINPCPEIVKIQTIKLDNNATDNTLVVQSLKKYNLRDKRPNGSLPKKNQLENKSKKKASNTDELNSTDLQPARCSKSFQDLGVASSENFSNYNEVDGVKIFTDKNESYNLSIKPRSDKEGNEPNLSSFLKTESQTSCNNVESIILNKETKSEFTFNGNSYLATTSQGNENNTHLREPSPLPLNIQADESMPARGELSEQESLGAENSTWNLFHGSSEINANLLEDWRSDQTQSVSVIGTKKYSKPFKCSACNEVFSCPKERRVHKNTVHIPKSTKVEKISNMAKKQKNYECNFCFETFTCVRDRKTHVIQKHHSEYKTKKSNNQIKKENGELETAVLEVNVKNEKTDQNSIIKTENLFPASQTDSSQVRYCSRCNLRFIGVKKLREHLRIVHKEVCFKCQTCSACFDGETEYNEHLLIHPLVCDKCGKTFRKKPNLTLHMKRHLEVKPYECALCPKSFITRQKLEEHTNSHLGKKPISCNLCDKTFSRHSNLIQHRNLHHLNVKKKVKDFVCRCGEVFHSLRKLEWHKEVHESKPKPCPFCSQKFIHTASVTRHIRRAHLPDYLPGENREFDNVQCLVCDKVYLRSSLLVHMRVHSGEKPFSCKICNKQFSTKWNLELHSWVHQSRSNMPYKCQICKSAFFREPDFIAHLNAHRNYKPYTCNVCGQKFIRKYSCLRHQEEHKKNKQFLCSVQGCEKTFHRSYYLKDHMKVHTGDRPHTCHICGKTSSTKSNHNKHVRIHDTREPVNTEN